MDLGTARRLARHRQRASATSDRDSFQLGGGLNLVDSSLLIKPGHLLAVDNYEMGVAGGYERLGGFERYDGQNAPSAESYYVVVFRNSVPFTTYMQPGLTIKSLNPLNGLATLLAAPVQVAPLSRNLTSGSEDLTNSFPQNWLTLYASVTEVVIDGPTPRDYGVLVRGVQGGGPYGSDIGPVVPVHLFQLLETANTGTHYLRKQGLLAGIGAPTFPIGNQLLMSIFLKRRGVGDRRYVRLGMPDSTFIGGVPAMATFDLATGMVSDVAASVDTTLMEDYGGGWWRCSLWTKATNTTLDGAGVSMELHLLDDSKTDVHAGDPTKGLYVSGLNCDTAAAARPTLGPYAQCFANGALPRPAGIAYAVISAVTHAFVSLSTGGSQDTLYDANGTDVGVWGGGAQESAAPSFALHQQYKKLAAAVVRALIQKVPGAGPIRGVWFYHGHVFAFRDDATPAACHMYRSTAAGWVEVTFKRHLDFTAGLAAGQALVIEGVTITGNTSGATGVVKRLNLTNSNWSINAAVGRLVFQSVTGAFVNGETLKVGATAVATSVGADFLPTWTPSGRYRFRTHNFYGASDKERMYGVNGLNQYFEYDDIDGVLASYKTGMVQDTPNRLGSHREMLFLAFLGGSIQNSGVGAPANWTVVLGASEITIGDDVSDFLEEIGDSLFIFSRNSTHQLLGAASYVFQLDTFDPQNGALEHTVQRIGFGIHLDDRGFASLETTDKTGNYAANTFSSIVSPLIERKLASQLATASVIYRRRNRYRCFFEDGTFISIGIRGPQSRGFVNAVTSRVTGFTTGSYGHVVRCACSEEDLDGAERIFFGSDDGYVYEAEKGTSFDGEPIYASVRLPFHYSGRPDHEKTYRSGRIEGLFPGGASLVVQVSLTDGEVQMPALDISADIGGALYNYQMVWEQFNFDAPIRGSQTFAIDSDGKNISLLLSHQSDVEESHTLRAVIFQTSMRTLSRETTSG
jgi:hypothetical protein